MHGNRELLGKRRDRAIATILSYKENHCDSSLPPDISQALRKVILDQINDVCNLAMDIIDDKVVINEEFYDRIQQIESRLDG